MSDAETTKSTFRVWVETSFEVEAASEDEACDEAMDAMAFGRASVSEAQVVRVEPTA